MAMGSRRRTPTFPVAAAVVSAPMMAPISTPRFQLKLSSTRGMTRLRRPPKRMAEMGTPAGFSYSGERVGHCVMLTVNREFG